MSRDKMSPDPIFQISYLLVYLQKPCWTIIFYKYKISFVLLLAPTFALPPTNFALFLKYLSHRILVFFFFSKISDSFLDGICLVFSSTFVLLPDIQLFPPRSSFPKFSPRPPLPPPPSSSPSPAPRPPSRPPRSDPQELSFEQVAQTPGSNPLCTCLEIHFSAGLISK